jgi:uncharacterized repeat protein (TIGR03803 family)
MGLHGYFYGTTRIGGPGGTGTMYQLHKIGGTWILNVLYTFSAFTDTSSVNIDGANSITAPIQAPDGNLYGTTYLGGSNGTGTVYTYSPMFGVFAKLFDFSNPASGKNNNNGMNPGSNLVVANDGNLYGSTEFGGAHGRGTIFKLTLPTSTSKSTLTTLYSFRGSDGANPLAGLIQAGDGNLYGTTGNGGTSGHGTVFRLTLSGTLTTLYNFTGGTDGSQPYRGIVQDSKGNFYGTTEHGGQYGDGVVFKLDTTEVVTPLHQFSAIDRTGRNTDGAYPQGGLAMDANNDLWGTTTRGGVNGTGTYFRISLDGSSFTTFSLPLGGNEEGINPHCTPIQDASGNFTFR